MELESRTRGACARPENGSLNRLSGSPIADTVQALWRARLSIRWRSWKDYHPQGKHWWVRLNEKGGKRHEMPAHHSLEAYPADSFSPWVFFGFFAAPRQAILIKLDRSDNLFASEGNALRRSYRSSTFAIRSCACRHPGQRK